MTRLGWADVAKGVCIVLVVFWHVVTKHVQAGDPISDFWITLNTQLLPLRMPLFFVVAGLFAARVVAANEPQTLWRRASQLFLVYVLWVLIQTSVLALTPQFDTARARTGWELLAQLTFSPTNLWFLLALAAYLVIGRAVRSVPTFVLLPAAFALTATIATGVIPDSGNLWQVAQNLFFFLIGLRCRTLVMRVAERARFSRMLVWIVLYAGALAAVALLGARQVFGVWPVLALLAVLGGVTACALIDRRMSSMAAPLRWLGQRTLPIYVIHMIPLALLDQWMRVAGFAPLLGAPVVALLEPPLMTALVIAASLGVHAVLVRCRLALLFAPLPHRPAMVRATE